MLVAGDLAEAAVALEPPRPGPASLGSASAATRSIVFLFSGQGSQYVSMGAGLYASEPDFP